MQDPRWEVPDEAFGRTWGDLVVAEGRRRLTDLSWVVARVPEKERPPNHLQETGEWEDNYKYSCHRRHVPIDALE
ncbi:hypothetical protein CesoFtcFv8_026010 [Champsocephalus esox]|uniref:Uncharacterized protein n=2 Tax=Champsocephalus TaxID=52236 RepID=A0AAN8GXS1_CHAGU|nr:hypothetical protein CesoFtcFv8_026010 [Champsocephalus esox]KAK5895879.1 hypothetical protein CgunFtcFv8_009536 [Champsocephalus gunnari]